jgi:putative heme-binding domain-containing protein
MEHPDSAIKVLAAKLFVHTSGSREEVIASYREQVSRGGDAHRGEAVFRRQCTSCHKIGDLGTAVGPDLTSAASRDHDVLLADILDPNRNLLPNFENYLCVDGEGRVLTGILKDQGTTSIMLLGQQGESTTILRANIDELTGTGKSLMPEGFENLITKEEMADLITFLQSTDAADEAAPLEVGTIPGMTEPDK